MKKNQFLLSIFLILLFTCYLYPCYAQHSAKEIGDYSIEINFSSNQYRFKEVPDMANSSNPLNRLFKLFAGDMKSYGSDGFGLGFSRKINNKSRIEINPSFYNVHNQLQYSTFVSVGRIISMQNQTFSISGFSIPVSYISYFKIPKRKVSCYFIGGIQYSNYKLVTVDNKYKDSVLTSSKENHYKQKGTGITGGIGVDYKIKSWIYLFYGFEGGISLRDVSFFGDVRIGAGFNLFKKK